MNCSEYDSIAEIYDSLFADKDSIKENEEVGLMIRPLTGNVLDIGCGTGLLTEIKDISPDRYLGIDPSSKMLDKFREKHPKFRNLICAPYDGNVIDCRVFDNVISLFGSPSYLSNYALLLLEQSPCKLFLMFYGADYHPVTYEKCGVEFNFQRRDLIDLTKIFKSCSINHSIII